MGFGEKIIKPIQNWFQKLTAAQKRRFILVCTGVFSLILTLAVIIPLIGKKEVVQAEQEIKTIIAPIPEGELFIPDEPDFIPGILLERERRTEWTEENAAEHWQEEPLKQGEEQLRIQIENTIEEILERVP